MVSDLFDPAAWRDVPGFDFDDITYHRAVDQGTVRIAFNRPEVRNAFRPRTVSEMIRAFDDVRARLAEALTMPVRWRETLLAMRDMGADRFVEVGPGRVLTGLVKRTLRDVELANA